MISDRSAPLLFSALPDLAKKVPWMPLARLPTDVEPCDALTPWLGRTGIFMKRDDLISPIYGGNKVRRYEYLLAEAKALGATRIVTTGGLASTQMMATALFGRALGMKVVGVLFDQPITNFARESIRGFAHAGAELFRGGNYLTTAWRTYRALRKEKGSYLILPGAGSPLANLGYVDAMLELHAQVERGEAPRPDVIVVPAGSSGTLVALALGAAWLGWETEVLGVRITTPLGCNRGTIAWLIRHTDRFIEQRDTRWRSIRKKVRFGLYKGALGRGYGYPTEEAEDGVERIRALTGVPGEITYSGKAIGALRHIASSERYRKKTILFWNTLSSIRPTPPTDGRIPEGFESIFQGC